MRHLHILRQFRVNVIWIVTFWLQCHISILLAIIKFNNITIILPGPVSPISNCARFRNVRHHSLVSECSTLKKVFGIGEDST